jgi:imidazolonepropionase-like amidohydrolase
MVYDGNGFVSGTLAVRRGTIVAESDLPRDGTITTTRLDGLFIVPAFGDAHTHRFTEADGEASSMFLSTGVAYVHNLNGNVVSRRRSARDCNTQTTPEACFANAGFTCSGGHPVPLYTFLDGMDKSRDPSTVMDRIADYNFYVTDTLEDLNEKWPKFARSDADAVKLFLLHSERWHTPEPNKKSDGLRPEIAREISRRAKQAGLRIAAHVESAADLRLALDCAVDLLAHMPGYGLKPVDDPAPFVCRDEDLQQAAKAGMAIAPTLGLIYADPSDPAGVEAVTTWKRAQVARWKAAGVNILHGSDNYFNTRSEISAMIDSGLWTGTELLELLSVRTPRWIFPGRSIGSMAPGFEATFVVLGGDPTVTPAALLDVRAVYKDGIMIWEKTP